MEATTKFNGYANYETWAMASRLRDDAASCRYWKEAAREEGTKEAEGFEEKGGGNVLGATSVALALRLQAELTESAPEVGPTAYADLPAIALAEVDWFEVADSIIEADDRLDSGQERKFPLGFVVTTRRALEALSPADIDSAIARHASADWGEGEFEGFCLRSDHRSVKGVRFLVITDPKGLVTMVLLPSERY